MHVLVDANIEIIDFGLEMMFSYSSNACGPGHTYRNQYNRPIVFPLICYFHPRVQVTATHAVLSLSFLLVYLPSLMSEKDWRPR